MDFICQQSKLDGRLQIPASKSHTIRAVAIAAMAEGESILRNPLDSADTLAAAEGVQAFGATVEQSPDQWRINGVGGRAQAVKPTVDVGNSGTTLRVLMGLAGLLDETDTILFTGDDQIQKRPVQPLIDALNQLGAHAECKKNNGCAPCSVSGRIRGGQAKVEAKTSQYLTSLLMACPLAGGDTELTVPLLFEKPYVQMTLNWLETQNIRVEHADDFSRFHIPGSQHYTAFDREIPADFSSATFFLGAGALPGNHVTCLGLDMDDTQGDKAVIDYLKAMGARVSVDREMNEVTVEADDLNGVEIDMNDTPDALPVMAVLGCFAKGETRLVNVAQARIKETDRIAVMAQELGKMGADVEELEDGLIIRESQLHGATVHGHADHRVVMALALAGLNCPGETTVVGAEAARVTFPDYHRLMQSLNAQIRTDCG
jgi:3-phosphoshikimate 1-carboxyvinyltransferase